jgi:hypothetical protein
MHKVVLLTDRPEECETLISCLKILFPECEVLAQPKYKLTRGEKYAIKIQVSAGTS